ncbi:hypothetical protein [Achromobacter arsenitoxydans]|uniref:Uncharacterized protein n=1 Tax=Achromobacter arsenitoxydans SY8 TaxID=477184 RepID=H0F6R2_9BURK|nr:hypothetical protein [Achromobacter arsenitoxydans]EHK65970.1 hypothetical protein KYC_12613 [Achromobacter arsenitoxydans SY8]
MDMISALASMRALIDFTKVAVAARDDHQIAQVEQRLTRVLLDVTSAGLELQQKVQAGIDTERALKDRVRELEEQVADLVKRAAERERYKLAPLSEDVFALALKEECAGTDPHHHLCQPCMDNRGKKATLQRKTKGFMIYLTCPECSYDYPTGKGVSTQRQPLNYPSMGRF